MIIYLLITPLVVNNKLLISLQIIPFIFKKKVCSYVIKEDTVTINLGEI